MKKDSVQLLCDKREIKTYKAIFDALKNGDQKAELLFSLRNWIFTALDFDGQTGEVLESDMTAFLDRIFSDEKNSVEESENNLCEWIFKILDYCSPAMKKIFESPRTEILRFHEVQPLHQVREIDSAGLMEISRRPGRTVREKVSVNPKVFAVKHAQSVDTAENRLLKTFCLHLLDYLEIREQLQILSNSKDFSEDEDSFCSLMYNRIRRWLRSDSAAAIGKWQNLPPNNILLCDKHYKKIWKSHKDLQALNDLIEADWKNLDSYCVLYVFWRTLATLQHNGAAIFQQPVESNYNEIKIRNFASVSEHTFCVEAENFYFSIENQTISYQPKNTEEKTHKITIHFACVEIDGKIISDKADSLSALDAVAAKISGSIVKNPKKRVLPSSYEKVQDFAVIDFSDSEKSYCVSSEKNSIELPFKLFRQFWEKSDSDDVKNVNCAVSPAVYHEKCGEWSLSDVDFDSILFGTSEATSDFKNQATYDFMYSLKNFFNTNTLQYLLPDFIEDFSLASLRAAANSVFAEANPVPRSVGAVFALQFSQKYSDYLDKLHEDDFVFVIEKREKLFSVTPVQVKKSLELKNKTLQLNEMPEARKIPHCLRWEHHPAVVFDNYEGNKILDYINEALQKTEGWKNSTTSLLISSEKSIKDAILHLPSNWIFINEAFSSVEGLREAVILQKSLDDDFENLHIPLWGEHLPILQMMVIKSGKRRPINLTHGKTVLPIRGVAQPIEIGENFVLGKNVAEYHFRLTRGQGENAASLKYEARLSNPAFPLKKDIKCELKMNYNYGQEQPFELFFVPEGSGAFVQAKVEWAEIDESKFIFPDFPEARSWNEFLCWQDSRSKEPRNLTEWAERNFDTICDLRDFYEKKENRLNRYTATLTSIPPTKKENGTEFFYYKLSEKKYVRINTINLKNASHQFILNTEFSFSIDSKKHPSVDFFGNTIYKSVGITLGRRINSDLLRHLPRTFRFPTMQLWNIRKSLLTDDDVSETFKQKIAETKNALGFLLGDKNVLSQPQLWNELFMLACVLHSDGLSLTAERMEQKMYERIDFAEKWQMIEQRCFHFGYFIGDAVSPIQKKVFAWSLDFSSAENSRQEIHFKLQILTIALWRSEELLQLIEPQKMKELFEQVRDAIEYEFCEVQYLKAQGENLSNRKLNPLRSHLELLVAVLRSRKFGDDFQKLFSPFNPEIQSMISKVEEITDFLSKNEKNLYARQIKFVSSDADAQNNFLDYLLRYLDGENSSEMPKIETATDDAESEVEEADFSD